MRLGTQEMLEVKKEVTEAPSAEQGDPTVSCLQGLEVAEKKGRGEVSQCAPKTIPWDTGCGFNSHGGQLKVKSLFVSLHNNVWKKIQFIAEIQEAESVIDYEKERSVPNSAVMRILPPYGSTDQCCPECQLNN